MSITLIADKTRSNLPVEVPEDNDDAYAETISKPAQALLNRSEKIRHDLKGLEALTSALYKETTMPPLEAAPESPSIKRNLRINVTNLEPGRTVNYHLAAFLIEEPSRIPIYVAEFSTLGTITSPDQVINLNNLPANLYWNIQFDAGIGYKGAEVHAFLGVKHTQFNIGRIPDNTPSTPLIYTFNVERWNVARDVELVLTRVAPEQLIVVSVHRDMNGGDLVEEGAIKIVRTSNTQETIVDLGEFNGGAYYVTVSGELAGLSDSGKLYTTFTITRFSEEEAPLRIYMEGLR